MRQQGRLATHHESNALAPPQCSAPCTNLCYLEDKVRANSTLFEAYLHVS